jgi:hypothetical protein
MDCKGIDPWRKIGLAGVFAPGKELKSERLASHTCGMVTVDLRSTHSTKAFKVCSASLRLIF